MVTNDIELTYQETKQKDVKKKCNYSAESGVGCGFSPLGVKISVFPYTRYARIAKLAYAQTVAMHMGSRSLPKNNEIVSATAYEKPPPPPPEIGEMKLS